MRPYDLKCEYRTNPLGIDALPRFFWKLKAPVRRGAMQSARRILVSDNTIFEPVLWDSGEVKSARSIHVQYDGPALKPRTRYWWKVQAWDDEGNSDGWSEQAWFETGLMDEGWSARWISAEKEAADAVCPLMRRAFHVDGSVQSARVYATARGVYGLWINGRSVGDSLMNPGWTVYSKRLQYQTFDVTGLIRDADNAIGAMLANGWYRGELGWQEKDRSDAPPRELLLQLHIQYTDGREQLVASNGEWKAADGPLLMSEIYHGEQYDARLEIPGWSEPGTPKGIWRDVEVAADGGRGMVVAQDGLPVRRVEELRPKALFTSNDGERVLDMGQNMVGFLRFRVQGNPGDRVVLRHFEVLDREGNVYFANLRRARQTIEYTLRGDGEEVFEPLFSFQGFQYVQIVEWPGEPKISAFTGVVVHSDMEPTGIFSCNEELINKLQHNIQWGQKGNFLDVPTDCPQRDERLGWTGDAQVFISTACFNYQSAPFFTKWLRDMAADQRADGGIPFVIPNALPEGHSSAAWADAATICPWTIYEYYDDKRLLAECYPMMKRWVDYIRAQGNDEYLWNTGFHFGDWLALDAGNDSYIGATSRDLIATAYYALSTRLVAQAAAILGNDDDEEEYSKLYKHVRRAFREEFVTPSGRLACPTQTAQVLGLHFDLLDKPARRRAAAMLKSLIEERGGHLTTGFVGTPYLCHALTDSGLHEEACALIMKEDYPSWLYPLSKGATTMWEHWDCIKPDGSFWSPEMNSFNHYAYGSIGDWLYRNILGIAPDVSRPGFGNVIVSPMPGGKFREARGSLDTLYGEVSVSWRLSGSTFELNLTIPENTTATVTLPGAGKRGVEESGRKLAQAEGISDIERSEGGVTFTAGSGIYRFQYPYKGLAVV